MIRVEQFRGRVLPKDRLGVREVLLVGAEGDGDELELLAAAAYRGATEARAHTFQVMRWSLVGVHTRKHFLAVNATWTLPPVLQ